MVVQFRDKDRDPDRHLRDALMGEVFRPFLNAAKQSTAAAECNLLCLAPSAWGVSWLSSSGEPEPKEQDLPQPEVPFQLPLPSKMHAHLFSHAADFIQENGRRAFTWAQFKLGRAVFPLTGHARSISKPPHALWCPTNTCTDNTVSNERAPTLFQTALEWAASGHDSTILENDPFLCANLLTRGRVISTTTRGSMRVGQFATRPGLVDRDNYEQFLAEHIRILGQAKIDFNKLDDPTIESHLLPMRCLGQWRAAFDLKGIATRADREAPTRGQASDRLGTTFMSAASERLLSYVIVSAFRQAIDVSNHNRGPLTSDIHALLPFSLLWWSKEVSFVQDGKTVARLSRNHTGSFRLEEDAPPPKYRPVDSFLSRFDADQQWTGSWIVMDLRKVGNDFRRPMYESWGFNEIHFRVPLLDAGVSGDEWNRIEFVVKHAVRRTLRTRFYSIDSQEAQENFNRLTYLSHGIGNALNAANNRLHSLERELAELTEGNVGDKIDRVQTKAAVVGRQLKEAQGLAYFARTGLRELENGPPREWMLEPGEPEWTPDEARAAMHQVLTHYLGAYEPREDTDRMSLVFCVGPERQDYTLQALSENARKPKPLTIPPFSRHRLHDIRGGAPLFLLTLGLAEILRNARSQLVDFWPQYANALPADAARLLIDLEVDDRCDISVVVGGLARPKHNLHSDSLARIIRAERSLPPARRLMTSEQAMFIPGDAVSPLHHPESGFVPTVARWTFLASAAKAQLSERYGGQR